MKEIKKEMEDMDKWTKEMKIVFLIYEVFIGLLLLGILYGIYGNDLFSK